MALSLNWLRSLCSYNGLFVFCSDPQEISIGKRKHSSLDLACRRRRRPLLVDSPTPLRWTQDSPRLSWECTRASEAADRLEKCKEGLSSKDFQPASGFSGLSAIPTERLEPYRRRRRRPSVSLETSSVFFVSPY